MPALGDRGLTDALGLGGARLRHVLEAGERDPLVTSPHAADDMVAQQQEPVRAGDIRERMREQARETREASTAEAERVLENCQNREP